MQLRSLDYEFELRKVEVKCNTILDRFQKFQFGDSGGVLATMEADLSVGVDDLSEKKTFVHAMDADADRARSPRSSIRSINRSSFISAATATTVDSLISQASSSPDITQMQATTSVDVVSSNIAVEDPVKSLAHHHQSLALPRSVSATPSKSSEPTPSKLDEAAMEIKNSVAQNVSEDTPLPTSKYLSNDLLPSNEKSKYYDDAIDDVLKTLQPHDNQFHYRASVVSLLKRQIRSCLFSTTFEVGMGAIRCFLPDDSTRLTVIISKSYISNWYGTLYDRLMFLAERGVPPEEEELGEGIDEIRQTIGHVVNSNVNVVKQLNGKYHVSCAVDTMDIEIMVNSRMDQCLLAFIEDVALLVGNDNLFKRSLLLIRAWWCYETASYVGCPIRHYLSDWAMCIMVCAVFNKHNSRISSPFQALCIFLAEYSGYDSTNSAITLQGIVPFQSQTSNIPLLVAPKPGDLISQVLIDKYRKVYLASTDALEECHFLDSRDTSLIMEGKDLKEKGEGPDAALNEIPIDPKPLHISADHFSSPINASIDSASSAYFERLGFNVVNPINESNMVAEKLSQRRLMRLSKAFQIGAANLSVFLKQSNENLLTSFNVIKNYFPAVSARFVDDWRPDAVGNSVLITRPDGTKVL